MRADVEQAPIFNTWTLRFHDENANRLFYQQHVTGQLAMQDRVMSAVVLFISAITLVKLQDFSLVTSISYGAAFAFLCTWLYLSSMGHPTVKHLYLRYRSHIVLTWRLLALIGTQMYHQRMAELSYANNSGSFPMLLLIDTCTFALAIQSVGGVLPFWLHLSALPVMLLCVRWADMGASVSSSLCQCCHRQVESVYHWLSLGAMIAQPLQSQLLAAAEHLPGRGTCPAPQLVLFVQVALGLVIPSVVLYRLEWGARMRFVAANAGRWGFPFSGVEPPRVGCSSWLLMDVGLVVMGLGGMWHLLEYSFD